MIANAVLTRAGVSITLVTAERAAEQPGHGQAELVSQQPPGGGGGDELVPGQRGPVVGGPLEHVLLAVVVRDQRDAPDVGSI